MNKTGDERKEKINDFFSEAEEDELRLLVSLNDKKGKFTSKDIQNAEEDFRPKIWGQAIEKEMVENTGEGYDLNIRSEISQFLSGDWNVDTAETESDDSTSEKPDDSELPDIDPSDANWSKKDKAVAMGGLTGILGFSFEPLRNIIYGVLSIPFDPLLGVMPFFMVVFIIAILTSTWSTLVRERILDVKVGEYREYISKLSGGEGGGMFGTPDNATEEEEEKIMEAQQSMMKAQMKPFGWTLILTIPMIIWIFTTANLGGVGTIVFPIIGEETWAGTTIGPIRTWIIWYASSSIVLSQVIKRMFDFSDNEE